MLFAERPRELNHFLISTENNEDCSDGDRSRIKRSSEKKPDYFIYFYPQMDRQKTEEVICYSCRGWNWVSYNFLLKLLGL